MEYSAFDKVPSNDRSYSFWDQTVFWFSACSLPAAWYYGALMAGWQGIIGAFVLILVVNTLSLLPWAYLGEIAAVTGGSSVAIVRPAFGIKGSVVPSVFYLILGFGWAVVNVFLGAIALSFIFKLWLGLPSYLDPGNLIPMIGYILIVCLIQGIFAVAGHQVIKKVQWIATIFFLILGAYQTYMVFQHWGVYALFSWKPQGLLHANVGPFTYRITFALLVDLLIAYNWTWEFIGDFSRFSKNRVAGTWGPFIGANMAQFWWFFVGALAVVYLSVTTGTYSPLLADPSSTTVTLGLGWLAALIILLATVSTNAANIYASALGMSNLISGKKTTLKTLLKIVAITIVPLSLSPLMSKDFVGFYIFFLDFLGAIVIPLWTLTLVDYFIVKNRHYTDDLYKKTGGEYWYKNGWNWPAVVILLIGTFVYWIFGYAVPMVRQTVTAALPTILVVGGSYVLCMRRVKSK
jgi:nucleobase:cation symporter-1, NCS1 family